ncbi:MAG: hypothetical protein KME40_32015 [Komarekiella atlantica HA4396-MV6]|jgi:hypothetical protein|nr:hypothetical protein [Komarekiella atlantica HA4396-MV6]
MAEQCKDIDTALANLNKALREANNRNKQLENRVKRLEDDNSRNPQHPKNNQADLAALAKRVSVLESYCASIEDLLSKFKNLATDFFKEALEVFQIFGGIFK